MGEVEFWPRLVLAILATWRLTHLLAREDGPAELVARMRARLGAGALGRALDCFHCLSLWIAAPLALWLTSGPWDWLFAWLALSGAACLLERLGERPVLIEAMGGQDDGMLRTAADGDAPAGDAPRTRSGA